MYLILLFTAKAEIIKQTKFKQIVSLKIKVSS